MLETNIRLVLPGDYPYLEVRRLNIKATSGTPDIAHKIAGKLTGRLRRACVPSADGAAVQILVASPEPVAPITLESDDWTANLEDEGESFRLVFDNPTDQHRLANILHRALTLRIEQVTSWWRYDGYRIWFEPSPFKTCDDIAAFRRYLISSVILDGIGIGIAVDIGTAFFSRLTVADYFASGPEGSDRFNLLSRRQADQKGTMLYDLGISKHKCYFDEYCTGMSLATTVPAPIQGKSYPSLFDYVRQRHPNVRVEANDPVARVSFPGLDHPQPVPAAKLRVRVMNENLPEALSDVDKLSPSQRRIEIERFWGTVGCHAFGANSPRVAAEFWKPSADRIRLLAPPALVFGKGRRVEPPLERSKSEYEVWFRDRVRKLRHGGVLYAAPSVERRIFFAAPNGVIEGAVEVLAEEMCNLLTDWTGKQFQPEIMPPYCNLDDGMDRLLAETRPGLVVFVFADDDPASYFEIEYGLKRWRVKRITTATLTEGYERAQHLLGRSSSDDQPMPRELRDWRSFVRMCALDVLQKLDCVPWRVDPVSPFEAELSIDVGRDRRQFALSLLLNRSSDSKPDFWLTTVVHWKADTKRDSINPEVLRASVLQIFRRLPAGTPISSVLVLRDGRESGREPEALENAFDELRNEGRISPHADITLVDVHKTGARDMRLWEVNSEGVVENVLEGVGVCLDPNTMVLCTTGSATLHQGTADPILLTHRSGRISMDEVAEHFFHSAQSNYSSPGVAQRLAIGLKRTDEELQSRFAQEIRRIR